MQYRALQTAALHYPGGGMFSVRAGEIVTDAEIVRAHPAMFEPVEDRPIERATARPGEKRNR